MALGAQGRFDEAERALAASIRLHAAQGGPDARSASGTTWRSLGYLYRQMGALRRSERAYAQALRLARADASRRIALQESLGGLAATLFIQGRLAEARDLFSERLALVRELYGEDSVAVANAHRALVGVLTSLGQYAQAQAHRSQAIALASQLTGEWSTEYAAALESAALLDDARGDPANALRLFRRALAIRLRLHGAENGHIWRIESSIGQVLARQGDHEAAGPLVERAVAKLQRYFPDDLAGEASLRVTRAEWLLCRGDWDEAERALAAIDTRRFEAEPGLLLQRQALRAELEALRGRWPSAVTRWRAVVDQATRHFGPGSAATMKHRLHYAEALAATGRHAQARLELRQVGAVFARELVPGAPLRQRHAELARRLAR